MHALLGLAAGRVGPWDAKNTSKSPDVAAVPSRSMPDAFLPSFLFGLLCYVLKVLKSGAGHLVTVERNFYHLERRRCPQASGKPPCFERSKDPQNMNHKHEVNPNHPLDSKY